MCVFVKAKPSDRLKLGNLPVYLFVPLRHWIVCPTTLLPTHHNFALLANNFALLAHNFIDKNPSSKTSKSLVL